MQFGNSLIRALVSVFIKVSVSDSGGVFHSDSDIDSPSGPVTIWAKYRVYPLVLFVKVENEMIPLSSTPFEFNQEPAQLLVYGNPLATPTNFSLMENKLFTVEASSSGFLGLQSNYLTVSAFIQPTSWDVDVKGRVLNDLFYACGSFNNNLRYIKNGEQSRLSRDCGHVGIYLLRPDGKPPMSVAVSQKKGTKGKATKGKGTKGKGTKGKGTVRGREGGEIERSGGTKGGKKFIPLNLTTPHVFVAKIGSKYYPLSSSSYQTNDSQLRFLSYTISPDYAKESVEFTLKDNYAILIDQMNSTNHTSQYVSLSQGLILYGHIRPTKLNFDKTMKLQDGSFQSCEIQIPGKRGIVYGPRLLRSHDCIDVEIYFLPVSQASLLALDGDEDGVRDGDGEEDDVEEDEEVGEDNESDFNPHSLNTPHVFVAESRDKSVILSDHVHSPNLRGLSYSISSRVPENPAQFFLKKNSAIHIDQPTSRLGLREGLFVFGDVTGMELKFEQDMKLANGPFYACDIPGSDRRGIYHETTSTATSSCELVDIYFWPINPDNGTANTGNEQVGVQSNVQLNEQSGKLSCELVKYAGKPLVFFAHVNDSLVPLFATPYQFDLQSGHTLVYEELPGVTTKFDKFMKLKKFTKFTKFTLLNKKVYTRETETPGFVGLYHDSLAFGFFIQASDFDFDEAGRLLNVQFYACTNSNGNMRFICFGQQFSQSKECLDVDIYLLPSYRVSRFDLNIMPPYRASRPHSNNTEKQAEEGENGEEQSGSSDTQSGSSDTQSGSSDTQSGTSNPQSGSKKSESFDHLFVFVAKSNGMVKPLSNSLYKANGTELSFLFFGSWANDSIGFELEANYASTNTTTTPGNVGFLHGLIVFGPGVPRTELKLDHEGKLVDGVFHSCLMSGAEEYLIYEGSSNCPEVDIYLWPYKKAMGAMKKEVVYGERAGGQGARPNGSRVPINRMSYGKHRSNNDGDSAGHC